MTRRTFVQSLLAGWACLCWPFTRRTPAAPPPVKPVQPIKPAAPGWSRQLYVPQIDVFVDGDPSGMLGTHVNLRLADNLRGLQFDFAYLMGLTASSSRLVTLYGNVTAAHTLYLRFRDDAGSMWYKIPRCLLLGCGGSAVSAGFDDGVMTIFGAVSFVARRIEICERPSFMPEPITEETRSGTPGRLLDQLCVLSETSDE